MKSPEKQSQDDSRSAPIVNRDLTLKLIRFLLAGIPTFLVALPLNWLLVSKMGLPKLGTYACVLVTQTTVNFFICRWFVFREKEQKPMAARFLPFIGGVLLFRAADWAVYSILVGVFGLWYLGVQIANAVIFSLLKFAFVKKVMEK